ncbi:hypothetical protein DL767_009373 [Monosporascus sp. MG133]|nr:hypothetical protein DL767_009373 [Monosporascus sp. MG133]
MHRAGDCDVACRICDLLGREPHPAIKCKEFCFRCLEPGHVNGEGDCLTRECRGCDSHPARDPHYTQDCPCVLCPLGDRDGYCDKIFGCKVHCQTCGFDLERDPGHWRWCPWERRTESDPIDKQRPLVVKLTCRRAEEVHPGAVESIALASLELARGNALKNAERDWRARTKWVEGGGNADDWTWSPAHWQLYIECKHCWEAVCQSGWESQEPGYGYKPECPIAADLPSNPFKHPDHVKAVLGEQ